MFLTLFAFAVAALAILRSLRLASELRRVREERDRLHATVAEQRRGREEPLARPEVEAKGVPPLVQAAAAMPSRIVPAVGAAVDESHASGAAPAVLMAAPDPGDVREGPVEALDAASGGWESFVGFKGAPWAAGIASILAAIFFAQWMVDEKWLRPETAFTLMIASGLGALAAAEIAQRRKLLRFMNPVSCAGIALLYVGLFAAQTRYGLLSIPAAFACLLAVTVVGGLAASRYEASAPAVVSVLGGFATGLASLSDAKGTLPVFGFILLLDVFVLGLVMKRGWFGLLGLSLGLTLILELRWFWSYMSPESMEEGVILALVFGIFYLVLPMAAGAPHDRRLRRVSAIGALLPFLFALAFATSARYVERWPLLFLMLAVLDAATLVIAVLDARGSQLRGAAVATAMVLPWWALQGLKIESGASLSGSTLFAIFIASLFGIARRLTLALGRANGPKLRRIESAAMVAGAGLVLFGTVMVGYDRGAPVGPFLGIATALVLILIEVSGHDERLRGALVMGTVGLAALTQIWFLSAVNANTLIFYLAGPSVVSLFLAFLARRQTGKTIDLEAEIAVQASAWISIVGLFLALVGSDRTSTGWPQFLPLASTGWPLFLGLTLQIAVVIASVVRTNWTAALPPIMAAVALYLHLWQRSYLTPDQQGLTLLVTTVFYLCSLGLPLVAPFQRWRDTPLPWIASALAGPMFFFPLRGLWRAAFGEAALGLLPLTMAALSAVVLFEVSRRFVASEGDERGALLRLRHLTLYATVTAWFMATAIHTQFERQWITLGWAVEALALAWLYERLPHPVLPAFAGILFTLCGARLLFNPAVLEYEDRSLPILNWILYTYGGVAACAAVAQSRLRRTSGGRWMLHLADALSFGGILLGFWLVNLEILDYFSSGPHITLTGQRGYAVKLAFSVGWGAYAVALLMAGVARNLRPIRYLSLAFMILTVLKVFLYDLAALRGIFQVISFLGLAFGLLLVSFFYQRFVFRRSS